MQSEQKLITTGYDRMVRELAFAPRGKVRNGALAALTGMCLCCFHTHTHTHTHAAYLSHTLCMWHEKTVLRKFNLPHFLFPLTPLANRSLKE